MGRAIAAGERGRRGAVVAWCLFDFANSSFTTVIVTTVFSVYFVNTVVTGGALSGELAWSLCTSVSLLLSALLAPLLGALADARRSKRSLLITTSLACILATALLSTVGPGDVAAAAILFIIANVGFELGYVFYNGFLPEITTPDRLGRVSGFGWATGYIGGMVSLLAALVPLQILMPAGAGPRELEIGARIAFALTAAHFLIFAMPAFLMLKDRVTARPSVTALDLLEPFRRLATTFRHLNRYRQALRFIVANLIYNDGAMAIFIFAGIYMSKALSFSQAGVVMVVIWLNIPSAIGSFAFGYLNDRIGGKRTILITLAILVVSVVAIAATAPGEGATAADIARARILFLVLATVAVLGIGANQSASRGLMAAFIPEEKHAEFFGFFIFSGKLSSVAAPLTYGLIAQTTGSSAAAILSIVFFLLVGAGVLLRVDEEEGIRAARGAAPPVRDSEPGDPPVDSGPGTPIP